MRRARPPLDPPMQWLSNFPIVKDVWVGFLLVLREKKARPRIRRSADPKFGEIDPFSQGGRSPKTWTFLPRMRGKLVHSSLKLPIFLNLLTKKREGPGPFHLPNPLSDGHGTGKYTCIPFPTKITCSNFRGFKFLLPN